MYHVFVIFYILCSSIAASPPILNHPLRSQLRADNPAISSGFLLPSSSALLSNTSVSVPALRVPPFWSFSIGFLGDTFLPARGDSGNLSFNAHLDTGDPLPDWLHFAGDTVTFGGVTPDYHGTQLLNIVVTATNSLSLSTSDSFTLIVSSHDLSLSGPLQTRNVTADAKFSFTIDDWQGLQLDGAPVTSTSNNAATIDLSSAEKTHPPLSLILNTTSYPWLAYDAASRTLAGTPPASYVGKHGPLIPALVTFTSPSQSLTVSTNITLDVFPLAFIMNALPSLFAPPDTLIRFDLTHFIAGKASSGLIFGAKYEPQNVTWLHFDPNTKILNGTVPEGITSSVKVFFIADDPIRKTGSRAEMLIAVKPEDNGTNARKQTDRALRKSSRKVTLAVALFCGIIVAIILLAILLATCRRFCAPSEHVDGVYLIDQSVFKETLKSDDAYEKEVASDNNVTYSASPHGTLTHTAAEGRMVTKAAFFNTMRERFGSDGSLRGRQSPNVGFGSGKRARKSKISKPMAVISSSTSVRDGFADRARGGITKATASPFNGSNFAIFGSRDNQLGSVRSDSSNKTSSASTNNYQEGSSPGRVLLTPEPPTNVAVLHDRPRPTKQLTSASAGVSGPDELRSSSAPSLTTGTHTGTLSTFATGDSARLTNAAGEIPIRRPGFDGKSETLAERNMREMASPGAGRTLGVTVPSRALLNTGNANQTQKAPATVATTPMTVSSPKVTLTPTLKIEEGMNRPIQLKSAPPSQSTKVGSPSKSDLSDNRNSPGTTNAASKPGSEGSLLAPSSYHNVFSDHKGNESDEAESGADDAEYAVIRSAVQRTSDETTRQGGSGKPRLVAFTHQRTPTATGVQNPRRDVSHNVVVQNSEESDHEAEMRMGLEYVRRLGHSEGQQDLLPTKASVSRISLASNHTGTTNIEFYASGDSNGSIAGRTRVMSHLVVDSHRNRHQTAYSTESLITSSAEDSRWTTEAELPCIHLGPGEPFNFAAPLDRGHKDTSAFAGSALVAKQADGRPLPEWLRFRNVECEFWGVSPKSNNQQAAASLVTRVVVNIWEAERSTIVGGCVIDVLGGE